LAADLLNEFEPEIEQIRLIPSEGGRFEVEINGKLIYSKLATRRHAKTGEIAEMVRNLLKDQS